MGHEAPDMARRTQSTGHNPQDRPLEQDLARRVGRDPEDAMHEMLDTKTGVIALSTLTALMWFVHSTRACRRL
jgi:hypothetical protein